MKLDRDFSFSEPEEWSVDPSTALEKFLPIFFSILGSLILCTFLLVRGPEALRFYAPQAHNNIEALLNDIDPLFWETQEQGGDLIQEFYRRTASQDFVIDFFAKICGSREIAEVILWGTDAFNVPPALAFALCWEESRFNPLAINQRNRDGSIDRGLFQLNNRSFPGVEIPAFFDIDTNARYGVSHLRHCLDVGKTEIAALAMYNAGTGRVTSLGTPRTTLDYIHRILANRNKLEALFKTQLTNLTEPKST